MTAYAHFPAAGGWGRYPLGTRAYAITGGYWERVELGWKWCTGATFPTPGADVAEIAIPVSMTQVGWGIRAVDGSLFQSIAPLGWSTMDKELAKLKAHSWVVNGRAEVVPLYCTTKD